MIDEAVISADQNANDESLNIKALQETALKLWVVDQTSALELGRALIDVRDAMTEHGAFAKWFREVGMEESRVYYCIRKAEGKVKSIPKDEEPAFLLNNRNLAVAKIAPINEGRFIGGTSIHVGKNGTTATDGWVLVRVSLPPDSPVPDNEGQIPADMVPRLPAGNTAAVSFGKTVTTIRESRPNGRTASVKTPPTNATTTFPTDTNVFPPVDRYLKHHAQETCSQRAVPIDTLHKLINAARDFDPHGDIVLTFGSDNSVQGNMVATDGQTWFGLVKTTGIDKCKQRLNLWKLQVQTNARQLLVDESQVGR